MKCKAVLLAVVFMLWSSVVWADTFTCITNNAPTNCDIGEAQLTWDAFAEGTNQVRFRFSNAGPLASSITDVYFDDGSLLGIANVINGSGVDFSQGASPGDLPGGNTVGFAATAGFTADSNPPTQPNGVNPGEVLDIIFDLLPGLDFQDVLDAIALGSDPGGLRIGIHVQGFENDGSESFTNGGDDQTDLADLADVVNPVPEPSTALLMGPCLIALGLWMRRKFQARS